MTPQTNQIINAPLTDDEILAVLVDFADAETSANANALPEWATRYPALAGDFGRVAEAAWSQDALMPAPETPSAERFRKIGRAALAHALPGYAPPAPQVPLTNLLQTAKECGLSRQAFAAQLLLPDTLLLKLNRRFIDAATVPLELVNKMADALNRTADEIAAYLSLPAQVPQTASFRSDVVPQAKTESFADALSGDPEALPEHKAAWLDNADSANGGAA